MEYRNGPLPEVSQPFSIVLDEQNWPLRVEIFRSIFKTIHPSFRPMIPDLCQNELFSIAERDFLARIHKLLLAHGLGHITVTFAPEFRQQLIRK